MSWLLLAAAALVVLAGLCTSADVALVRVSRAGLSESGLTAGEGHGLHAVLAEVPRYVAVLLLARVAAGTGATVLVAVVLRHWIGPGWQEYAVTAAAMTLVLTVISGLIPRTLGQRYAAGIAGRAAVLLRPVARMLGPLPSLLLAVGRLFGGVSPADDGGDGSDDLRGLVDLLRRRRVIEPTEREMINSVVEFGDTIVREVMVPRTDVVFVEYSKTLRQGMSLALRSGFSRIPVIGRNLDDVVGIVYLKDIVKRSYENREADAVELVSSIMRPATFVPESKPLDDLLAEMQARQSHVAIVIDEYGGTAGLVTIEDILEEIVGEIADEYDTEQREVEWLGVDHARVTARLGVADLEDLFGVRIEAQDVETVGGLLGMRLGRVPIAGSTATVAGLRLTAESLAGRRNRISTVTVTRESAPGGPSPAASEGIHGQRPEPPDDTGQASPDGLAAPGPGAAGK